GRLGQRGVAQGDRVGQPVHHPSRYDDLVGGSTGAREAELVVDLTHVRRAGAASGTIPARDDPLGDAAHARFEACDTFAHRLDDAGPFVSEDEWVPHECRVDLAGEQLEVGAAKAAISRAEEHLARAGRELWDCLHVEFARALEDERSATHAGAPSSAEIRTACSRTFVPSSATCHDGRSRLIPVTLTAPTQRAVWSWTATPTQKTPSTSSSSSTAYPRWATASSSLRRVSSSVIVCGVLPGIPAAARIDRAASRSRAASIALPTAQQCTCSRLPRFAAKRTELSGASTRAITTA